MPLGSSKNRITVILDRRTKEHKKDKVPIKDRVTKGHKNGKRFG